MLSNFKSHPTSLPLLSTSRTMNGDDMCLSDQRNKRQLSLGDALMMLSALRERARERLGRG